MCGGIQTGIVRLVGFEQHNENWWITAQRSQYGFSQYQLAKLVRVSSRLLNVFCSFWHFMSGKLKKIFSFFSNEKKKIWSSFYFNSNSHIDHYRLQEWRHRRDKWRHLPNPKWDSVRWQRESEWEWHFHCWMLSKWDEYHGGGRREASNRLRSMFAIRQPSAISPPPPKVRQTEENIPTYVMNWWDEQTHTERENKNKKAIKWMGYWKGCSISTQFWLQWLSATPKSSDFQMYVRVYGVSWVGNNHLSVKYQLFYFFFFHCNLGSRTNWLKSTCGKFYFNKRDGGFRCLVSGFFKIIVKYTN